MKLCHLCKLFLKNSTSILDFPFKIYESKKIMAADLYNNINSTPNYLLTINKDYNSNILHEMCYYLSRSTFINKKFRKQYIWGLEILSTKPEFKFLCNNKNSNNEVPLECFIRKSEDRNYKSYEYIKCILKRNTLVNINVVEPEKVILDPLVADITNKYHNFQNKLFEYFETNFDSCISRCELCQQIIDIFDDLNTIAGYIKNNSDKNKDLIVLTIKHIIILRNRCVKLCEDNKINHRHKHIITYFDNVLIELN
jgi:hypothetical protein